FHVTGVQTCALPILRGDDGHSAKALIRMEKNLIRERNISELFILHSDIQNILRALIRYEKEGPKNKRNVETIEFVRNKIAEGKRSEERRVGKECRER